jgi:8-oxo-dGTP pyrophosphatase MutT (NUDIX family)
MLPLDGDVTLRIVRAMPALDPALDEVVERHWQRAQAAHRLFNGQVFTADRVAPPGMIDGHWTEYRRVVAQMADPSLFPALRVRGVAVCGVLCGPDGVTVGRREAASVYQAGQWQLSPAGSVDAGAATSFAAGAATPSAAGAATPSATAGAAITGGADWRRALLAELEEELGLAEADVTTLRPMCLIQHPTGVLDIGVRIDTPLGAAAIHARHEASGDAEYDRLMTRPAASLAAAVEAEGGRLVPSSRLLLQRLD